MSNEVSRKVRVRRILILLRRLFLPLWSLEGELQGDRLRLLVAADRDTASYLGSMAFDSESSMSRKGLFPVLKASRLVESQADVVIVVINHHLRGYYQRRGFYILPEWSRQLLHMPGSPDEFVAGLGKSARAHIRKAVLRWPDYEITTDTQALEQFYNTMYRPYALQRFGPMAGVSICKKLKEALQIGALILMKSQGRPVSGAVIVHDGSTLYMPFSGVLPEGIVEARQGAKTALYYYALQQAHRWGCTEIDLGHSRPFLSDGILNFKLQWGASVLDDDDGSTSFAIAAPSLTDPARKFFAANRFYHVRDEQMQLLDEGEM